MMDFTMPKTQYTKSGCINIAYQVFGSGSIDLVYIPGWVSNIDLMWDCPELVNFLLELSKITRIILFDKRGTGLSDRIVELSTLEERMDDIRAVMDATGSKKAILFGHSEGGSVSALFAATYPNRTISLISFGIFAKRIYAPDYPWAPTEIERQVVYDMIENSWGSGDMNIELLAPSKARDKIFMNWLARYFRSGASPSAAMALTKMNTQVDIIGILGAIKVPSLILQRTNDIDVKIEEGKFIAERIEKSQFVELEGSDHLFWVGDTKRVLDHIKSFILNVNPIKNYEQQLFIIVTGRIITSNIKNSNHEEVINQIITRYRGKMVQYNEDTFIANFERTSKAVHSSLDLMEALKLLNIQLAIGIHIKELVVDENQNISRDKANSLEWILKETNVDQILITQTVRYLLSGTGLSFKPYKTILEPWSGNSHLLFTVKDHLRFKNQANSLLHSSFSKKGSFLETVLQIIDTYASDKRFGVERLHTEMGVSERQLQRKLKAVTNKSPIQLISSVRLHHAKELLLSEQSNVTEAASKTGFSNLSYFSKCFKKEFGLSPSSLLGKHARS